MKTLRVTNAIGRPRAVARTTNGALRGGQATGEQVVTGAMIGGDVGDRNAPANHGGGVSVLSDTLFVVQSSGRAPKKGA